MCWHKYGRYAFCECYINCFIAWLMVNSYWCMKPCNQCHARGHSPPLPPRLVHLEWSKVEKYQIPSLLLQVYKKSFHSKFLCSLIKPLQSLKPYGGGFIRRWIWQSPSLQYMGAECDSQVHSCSCFALQIYVWTGMCWWHTV